MTSPAIFNNTPVTMTSLEIADLVDSRHDKVKQSIERLAATVDGKGNQKAPVIALPPMGEVSNTGFGPRTISVYHLCKRDSLIVVAQLCPEFTARIVDRWQELEAAQPTPATLSRMEILKLAMESEQARIQAEEERDKAIATKHLIGSRREATAMATASRATVEANKLRDLLGASTRHASVRAVQNITKKDYAWLPMRKWCQREEIAATDVVDPLYGDVKAWPAGAWMDCHGVDIKALFGGGAA